MSILIITGTGTGVGKTVVAAALAALAQERGSKVAVVKPAQTGVSAEVKGVYGVGGYSVTSVSNILQSSGGVGEAGGTVRKMAAEDNAVSRPHGLDGTAREETAQDEADLEVVRRLAGVTDLHELARFPDPLSPEAAARAAGVPPLDLCDTASYIGTLSRSRDLVLVEGAGGLLVRYDPAGATLADLARLLDVSVLVVTEPGLGTLNHTALTLEALASRGLTLAGVVIGRWPADPGAAERSNLTDFESIIGEPVAGALPDGCGRATAPEFLMAARAGLTPRFGGEFDPAVFTEAFRPVSSGRPMWQAPTWKAPA